MFFDHTNIKPYTTVLPLERGYEYYHYKWFQTFYGKAFRTWLNPEFMTIES